MKRSRALEITQSLRAGPNSGDPVFEDAAYFIELAISTLDKIEKLVESYVGGEYESQGRAAENILCEIREMSQEECEYCLPEKYTGLPGNACENCMNTGLKYPTLPYLKTEEGNTR